MLQHKRQFRFLYQLIDILLILFSCYCAYNARKKMSFLAPSMVGVREYLLVVVFWGTALFFLLHSHNLYSTDRDLTFSDETFKIFKVVFISAILANFFLFGSHITGFSRSLFFLVVFFLFLNLSVWRIIKRALIIRLIRRGLLTLNVLIVGAEQAGMSLLSEIQANPNLGLKVVGFLDDEKVGTVNGTKILGRIGDFDRVVHTYFIEEVYLTLLSNPRKFSEIIFQGRKLGKTIKVILNNFDSFFGKISLGYIGSSPLIKYYESDLYGAGGFFKRVFDFVIAGLLLVLLSPALLIIALFIKFYDDGPICYISKRCGKKNRIFDFYKFRTMIVDADLHKDLLRHKSEVRGPIFKIKDDPRITRFGKFLRRYSLDELPQLVNVLKGDMSLVGPRPPTPDEVTKYDYWQMRRLSITPGMTGLWQIRGRSDASFYKLVKWDLWYINNWSLWLDIKILFWTIPAILRGKGAY